MRQRARAEKIDDDRYDDHAEGPDGRFDHMAFMLDKALGRFPDHHARQQKQQGGFSQRRDRFDFAVSVVMFFVGRFAGNANGDVGHDRGAEIDQRMAGFRQDGQRAGGKAHHTLRDGQAGRGRDRGKGDLFFFALHVGPV